MSGRNPNKVISILAVLTLLVFGVPLGASTVHATESPTRFTPLQKRILDTRAGTALQPGSPTSLVVAGVQTGVPLEATAVSIGITALGATTDGDIVINSVQGGPPVSYLRYLSSEQSSASAVVVPDQSSGKISITATAQTHLIIEIQGYWTKGAGSAIHPLDPARRIVDTRTGGLAARIAPGSTTDINVGTLAHLTASATAAFVSIVSIPATSGANGYLTVYPSGSPKPTASLNSSGTRATTNSTTVGLGSDHAITIYNGSASAVDIIIDLQAYFTDEPDASTRVVPISTRVYDTRYGVILSANETRSVKVSGIAGIPSVRERTVALFANLKALSSSSGGWLSASSISSSDSSPASVLNFSGDGSVVDNLAVVAPGYPDDSLLITNHSNGSVHIIIDIEAYVSDVKPYGDIAPEPGVSSIPNVPDEATSFTVPNLSGTVSNGGGEPLPGQSVLLQAIDADSGDSVPIATVTTDANGIWNYTLPTSLPPALSAIASRKDGVLNVITSSTATYNGKYLSAISGFSVGVVNTSVARSVNASVSAPGSPKPVAKMIPADPLASEPVDLGQVQGAPPAAIGAESAPAPQEDGDWQAAPGVSESPYRVGGVDYTNVKPAAALTCDQLMSLKSKVGSFVRYTNVGEVHAFWDVTSSFQFFGSTSMQTQFAVTADFKKWSLGGSHSVSNVSGVGLGTPDVGPFRSYTVQIPVRYDVWDMKAAYGPCPKKWAVFPSKFDPSGGLSVMRLGSSVAYKDGYLPYSRNASFAGRVKPGGYFIEARTGRSTTFGNSLGYYGLNLSSSIQLDRLHAERIKSRLYSTDAHLVWPATRNWSYPGMLYSY